MFNNYSLSNLEIEKILIEFESEMKLASKRTLGRIDDECIQAIRIAIFNKLSKNRNWKNETFFKNFSKFCVFYAARWHLLSRRVNNPFRNGGKCLCT